MSATHPCDHCGRKLAVRFDTDGMGRMVEAVEPCGWCQRKRAGLCQRCHTRPVFARKGYGLWCTPCYPAVQREQQKRIRRREQDSWKHAGVCMDCKARPVYGKVGWAETCEACRDKRKCEASKRSYQNDPAKRQARNEYKRQWRKKNRAKVKMQKRRSALRGRTAERMRRYRERVAMGEHNPRRSRWTEDGERLCLRRGCPHVLTGRAKLCDAHRAGRSVPRGTLRLAA